MGAQTAEAMWFWAITAFVFGITIGSFLNVVIWRLPRNQSLMSPSHSYCPKCGKSLSALDLVPLFSFLALGRKCRQCKAPISWRYFSVELLTGILFVLITLRFLPNVPDCVSLLLFACVMVPVFFIDLDTFTIPNSLNLLAFAIPVGRDIYGIVAKEPNHALIGGWLPTSVLGGLVGALIFGVVRIAGWLWKRVEAMGLGDVLLGRGMGAMLVGFIPLAASPLRLFPIWVILSVSSGAIIGVAALLAQGKQESPPPPAPTPAGGGGEQEEEAPSSFGQELFAVGFCLWLGDLWEYIGYYQGVLSGKIKPQTGLIEDDFVAGPTHIPFGPFMVLGFFLTVFIGEWLTSGYLRWAFPPAVRP